MEHLCRSRSPRNRLTIAHAIPEAIPWRRRLRKVGGGSNRQLLAPGIVLWGRHGCFLGLMEEPPTCNNITIHGLSRVVSDTSGVVCRLVDGEIHACALMKVGPADISQVARFVGVRRWDATRCSQPSHEQQPANPNPFNPKSLASPSPSPPCCSYIWMVPLLCMEPPCDWRLIFSCC